MLPIHHLIITTLISLPLFKIYKYNIITIIASGVLIDIDHLISYYTKTKNLNIKKAYKYYLLNKPKKPTLFIFHNIEFLLLLIILSSYLKTFYFISIGITIHYILDIYQEYKLKIKIKEPSIIKHLVQK